MRKLFMLSAALILCGCPPMRPTVAKDATSFVKVKVQMTSATGLGPVTFLQEVGLGDGSLPMAQGTYQSLDFARLKGIERVFAALLLPIHTIEDGLPERQKLPSRFRTMVALQAFGLLSTATGDGCTATHVGHGVVITAGHCFLDRSPLIRTNFACDGATIKWGLLYEPGNSINSVQPSAVSECLWVDAAEWTNARDYAIFHVSPEPPAGDSVNFSRPTRGSGLTIYSHPVRRPLEWSGQCSLLAATSVGTQFAHKCSTEPGSSGAAVFSSDTEPFSVVGIHDGGYSTTPTFSGYNYATYVAETPLRRILNGTWPPGNDSAILARRQAALTHPAAPIGPIVDPPSPERVRIHAGAVTDSVATAPRVAHACALTDTEVTSTGCVAQCWEYNSGGKLRATFPPMRSEEECNTRALLYCQGMGRSYCGYNFKQ